MYAKPLVDSLAAEGEFFDEDIFLYGEDTDVDWRAHHRGWRCVYVPTAVAYHRGSHADESLKVDAIAHRYLGVLKNARASDLLSYNLPLMALHVGFRLMVSPRQGLRLAQRLFRLGPRMLAKRSPQGMTRGQIGEWLAWSQMQETAEPMSWGGRLGSWRVRAKE
jgi:GT2 family glycosyltransferase